MIKEREDSGESFLLGKVTRGAQNDESEGFASNASGAEADRVHEGKGIVFVVADYIFVLEGGSGWRGGRRGGREGRGGCGGRLRCITAATVGGGVGDHTGDGDMMDGAAGGSDRRGRAERRNRDEEGRYEGHVAGKVEGRDWKRPGVADRTKGGVGDDVSCGGASQKGGDESGALILARAKLSGWRSCATSIREVARTRAIVDWVSQLRKHNWATHVCILVDMIESQSVCIYMIGPSRFRHPLALTRFSSTWSYA